MSSGNVEASAAPKNLKWFGLRHVQFVLLFFCLLINYGIRTNMSVGIIAMTQNHSNNVDIATYPEWSDAQNDIIKSSFFWGYVIPQVGAGQIVKKWGPKWFLLGAVGLNGLLSLLIPVMAECLGVSGVVICRVLQGLSQGFIYPSVHTLLGKWTPIEERSKVGSFVYTAGPLGTAVSLPVTGYISDSMAGWPTAFYLYGGLALGWAILWGFLGADTPAKHKSISEQEKNYIQENSGSDEKQIPTPWKHILTSLPFWAIFVAQCGQNWGFWTLLTEIPTYMEKIMGYKLSENGLLSALPYIFLWLLNFILSPLADYLIVRKVFTIGTVRKIFESIGILIPAAALLGLTFVDSSQKTLALILLIIAVGSNAGTFSGYIVNIIDIAPNFSGTLMGLTNGPTNIFSIVAPLVLQMTGKSQNDPELWNMVFYIAAGIYTVTHCFYLVFASGEVQPWNEAPVEKDEDVENNTKSKQT